MSYLRVSYQTLASDGVAFLYYSIVRSTTCGRLFLFLFNYNTHKCKLQYEDGFCVFMVMAQNGKMTVNDTMKHKNEDLLDYLIYNDPIAYADLILNGDPETYLKTVTEYKPLDS